MDANDRLTVAVRAACEEYAPGACKYPECPCTQKPIQPMHEVINGMPAALDAVSAYDAEHAPGVVIDDAPAADHVIYSGEHRAYWVIERYIANKLCYWASGAVGRSPEKDWAEDFSFATKLADNESAAAVLFYTCNKQGRTAEHMYTVADLFVPSQERHPNPASRADTSAAPSDLAAKIDTAAQQGRRVEELSRWIFNPGKGEQIPTHSARWKTLSEFASAQAARDDALAARERRVVEAASVLHHSLRAHKKPGSGATWEVVLRDLAALASALAGDAT